MARRSPAMDPELKAHQEWLGYLQPVGLVVAPAAMQEAGWVVTRSGSELIERQARYRAALEPLDDTTDPDDSDTEHGFRSLLDLLTEHLGWDSEQLDRSPEAIQAHTKELQELGDTLTPTAVVPAANGEGAQLLVVELPLAAPFDQKSSDADHLWRASAQERLERLLRETGVEAGLLFNGSQLRLVVAPKGESSGHLTFRLSELAEVSGRLMLSGLDLLLCQSHAFLDPDGYRLTDVLKKSRSFQAVVSNALADQVLAALWDLLRGFQQANELSQQQDNPLLGDLPERDAQQLYGGLISMLMRLVFLLYAEDEALMPGDAVYEQNYKLSAIFEQLQQDESEYPDTMEQRFGAWAGLMSLCRLVFDGGGPTVDYLPARHGQLFDPGVYPWLETPWISDGVVLAVLRNLLVVQGERISYRALDVEQIGSVYEGIMGYAVQRIPGRCIGLKSKPQGAKKQITTAVDLDALLEIPGAKRKKWLEDEAGTSLPPKSASALKVADTEDALVEALAPRVNRELFEGPQAAGSLVFQPTEERRRSGSHYTPRSLTRPIVEEALRPWMERCEHKPAAAQILDLKICDPAMGSGAFLVESCRFLAELLEQAWTREGLPDALKPGGHALGEEPLIYARRLIAQSCLYGVDKNPFAVNLARLSLWLVSLSKDAPFTFVDHALKCGDSLVGIERSEIEAALKGASLQRELQINYIDEVKQQDARSFALFQADSRSDADDETKRKALEEWKTRTNYQRRIGDLLIAAFFNGKNLKERNLLKEEYLSLAVQHQAYDELKAASASILETSDHKNLVQKPLHWELEFPTVFNASRWGFDACIGNPPFAGNNTFKQSYPSAILDWLSSVSPGSGGLCDLVAHFFRRSFSLLRDGGSLGLIATNTIAQGDTRESGLTWICENGGTIFSAIKRLKWPGVAGVIISVVSIFKGSYSGKKELNGTIVDKITAFLFSRGGNGDPFKLLSNQSMSFLGSKPYGQGFVFDERGDFDDITAGVPASFSTMEYLLKVETDGEKVIKPYLGGDEVNENPEHMHHRYIIDFRDRSKEECAKLWPKIFEHIEVKVRPTRQELKPDGSFKLRKPLPQKWWIHGEKRPALYAELENIKKTLVISRVTENICFTFVSTDQVLSERLAIIASDSFSMFGRLQSSSHVEWVFSTMTSHADQKTYFPQRSFETYPFPHDMRADCADKKEVEIAARDYFELRQSLLREKNIGLTDLYNSINSPRNQEEHVVEMRMHQKILDTVVLNEYGWSDISCTYGYALSHIDLQDNAEIPFELSKKIDEGDLFFGEAEEALIFVNSLINCGAIKESKKLPWRYRWPDSTRDEVLGRLLALNGLQHAEEVALGLHSKGKKNAGSAVGKKRGKPAKTAASVSSEQMGLGL